MTAPACSICGIQAGETHLMPAERAGALARLIALPGGTVECDDCNNGLLETIVEGPPA